jgi:hypothetical protein
VGIEAQPFLVSLQLEAFSVLLRNTNADICSFLLIVCHVLVTGCNRVSTNCVHRYHSTLFDKRKSVWPPSKEASVYLCHNLAAAKSSSFALAYNLHGSRNSVSAQPVTWQLTLRHFEEVDCSAQKNAELFEKAVILVKCEQALLIEAHFA